MFKKKLKISLSILTMLLAAAAILCTALIINNFIGNISEYSQERAPEIAEEEVDMRADDTIKAMPAPEITREEVQNRYREFKSTQMGTATKEPIDYSKIYATQDSKSDATGDRHKAIDDAVSKLRHRLETEDAEAVLRSYQKRD